MKLIKNMIVTYYICSMKHLLLILFCSLIINGCSNNKNHNSNEQDQYVHLPNTIRGNLDNIPFYVDTSSAVQIELKKEIAGNDSIAYLMATDSLYADSIMNYLVENGKTECGADGQNWFGFHTHSGRWIDEEGNEWPWFNGFDNDTICPICNLCYDDLDRLSEEENIEWIVK